MSYKYRNNSTPDHVDSSQSNTSYPHTGIPITKTDATRVGMPSPDLPKKQSAMKEASSNYDSSVDRLKKSTGKENLIGADIVASVWGGHKEGRDVMDAGTQYKKAESELSEASKRKDKYSK